MRFRNLSSAAVGRAVAGSSARKPIVSESAARFRLGRSDVAGQMKSAGTA